jgi:hypothetical protein
MKNKILAILIITFFITSAISVQSITINKNYENVKTTKIFYENYIDNKQTGSIKPNEEPIFFGLIHGCVGNSHGVYSWTPCPFALVTTGINRARCGLYGYYSMRLFLYREYIITAHVKGFKPLSKYVYLTKEEPIHEIIFDMYESEPINIESKDNNKPIFFGYIYGKTGGVFGYASWPVGFTTLKFGYRRTISGLFGNYIICLLRIGKTYSITASKKGYDNLTLKVTLTEEEPIQRIDFYMHPDE